MVVPLHKNILHSLLNGTEFIDFIQIQAPMSNKTAIFSLNYAVSELAEIKWYLYLAHNN